MNELLTDPIYYPALAYWCVGAVWFSFWNAQRKLRSGTGRIMGRLQ